MSSAVLELLTLNLTQMNIERRKLDYEPQDPPLLIASVIGRLSFQLNNHLENLLIEGLNRKGFEFENRMELENFIKSNCRCEDIVDIKQRTYFVNDIPFFLHCYETEIDLNLNSIQTDREFKMSVNYGHYDYLQRTANKHSSDERRTNDLLTR